MTESVSKSSGLPLGVEPKAVLRHDGSGGYGVLLGGVNLLHQHVPSLRPYQRSGRLGDLTGGLVGKWADQHGVHVIRTMISGVPAK